MLLVGLAGIPDGEEEELRLLLLGFGLLGGRGGRGRLEGICRSESVVKIVLLCQLDTNNYSSNRYSLFFPFFLDTLQGKVGKCNTELSLLVLEFHLCQYRFNASTFAVSYFAIIFSWIISFQLGHKPTIGALDLNSVHS
jgi:hypothetical protein